MKQAFLFVCMWFASGVLPLCAQWSARVVSTGRTTGYIADLHLKNESTEVLQFVPDAWVVPPRGPYQGYVILPESHVPVDVAPGSSIVWPLRNGYCTDIHRQPVPRGEELAPFERWIAESVVAPLPLSSDSLFRGYGAPIRSTRRYAPPLLPGEGVTVLRVRPGKPHRVSPQDRSNTAQTRDTLRFLLPAWPDSGEPLRVGIDFNKHPDKAAPLLFKAIRAIRHTVDEMYRTGTVPPTPFAGDRLREEEALVQQTFWLFTSLLHPEDEDYDRDDFAQRIYVQYETSTGRNVDEEPDSVQARLAAGVDAFWNSFEAVGIQAKVLAPVSETSQGIASEPGRRCLRWGEVPEIDPRTGYDLIGDLYRSRRVSFDLNDVRFGYKAKVDAARFVYRNLETILADQFSCLCFECSEEVAHASGNEQRFPEFPWEEVFLTVDFCDSAMHARNHLSDFLDPDANLDALDNWFEAFGRALDNFGLPAPYEGTYTRYFSQRIDRALSDISEAWQYFREDMETSMALRYNRSSARARLWQAVVFAITTAASAGIAGATGGGAALLASVFSSTTGFLTQSALESIQADRDLAQAVGSLISLSIGWSAAAGQPIRQFLEGAAFDAATIGTLGAGLDKIGQQQVRGYALSMAVLDDRTWEALLSDLAEDYDEAALRAFEHHRSRFRAEVIRAVQSLCEVRNSLEELIPEMERALDRASRCLHPSFWRTLWQEAMDGSFDCCCAYSDGSGPSGSCTVTVPPFLYEPDER